MRSIWLVLLLVAGLGIPFSAGADNWTIQGSWVDSTPAGPEYSPIYESQCQVNSSLVWESLSLLTPSFSVTLVFAPTDLLQCRVRNTNSLGPVSGEWSAWITGVVAQMPANVDSVQIITIHQLQ